MLAGTVVPAALLGASVLSAPAQADTAFPASAGSTLVGLSATHAEGTTEGVWGRVYTSSEVGGEYPSADLSSDPSGLLDLATVGGSESLVNTTASGGGRAEAEASISGGFELRLPGYQAPAVGLATLHHSLRCDFSGNLEWESRLDGGSGGNDHVVTVFGTPIPVDEPRVSTTVPVPGQDMTADVTVENAEPTDPTAAGGDLYTRVTAEADGATLFDLTLGAVSVDCSEAAAGAGEEPAGEPPAETESAPPRADGEPRGGTPGEEEPVPGTGVPEPGADAPGSPEGSESTRPDPQDNDATGGTEEADGGSGETDGTRATGGLPVTGGALAGLIALGLLTAGIGGLALRLARRN